MKKVLLIVLIAIAMISCSLGPDHTSAEAFAESYVNALLKASERSIHDFYIQENDFDTSKPGAELSQKRMMGNVRAEYLKRSRNLIRLIGRSGYEIASVTAPKGEARAGNFLKNVTDVRTEVSIELQGEKDRVILIIEEMINTDGKWRLTLFRTVIDGGTENIGEVGIELPEKPEEE